MNRLTATHSIANTSDKWILVGNSHEVIASYDSKEDAVADLERQVPCIESSKWGDVQILAPGGELTGKYSTFRPDSPSEAAAAKAAFDEEAKAFPWLRGGME